MDYETGWTIFARYDFLNPNQFSKLVNILEFLELRRNHKFFEVCQTPELSAKATIMPLKRFDLDAAIIFSDILVIPQALGMVVEMHDGVVCLLFNSIVCFTVKLILGACLT